MSSAGSQNDGSEVDVNSAEFDDYAGPTFPPGLRFDLSQLFSPESLRGVAAVVVSVLVLRAPSQSPQTFAILLAVILLAWAVGGLSELRHSDNRTPWAIGRVAVLAALGLGLVLYDGFTGELLARLGGGALVVTGVVTGARQLRQSERGSRLEPVLESLLYIALGTSLLVAPTSVLGLAILILSVYWFLTGLATVVVNLRLDDRQISPGNTWQMFLEWIQSRPNTVDDRAQLYDKLFYEGDDGPRRLTRFFILMLFATTIAAFGVVADSTAVVIGAMLVAPLMTPLMGTSLSMTMGWPKRAGMSALVALGGIVFAIGLSVLFGWVYGPEISTTANSQVASRIGPTLIDLIIAVAAGGAGAFALSRPDVSDSLPGVAVAIALVPPLAVVGLMVSQTNWSAATGALLLFTTNLVAILLFGGLVFILTGVVPILRLSENREWVKKTVGMVGILAIGVVAVLAASAETFERQSEGLRRAEAVLDEWLTGTDLSVSSAIYEEETYKIVITGSDEPPAIEDLGEGLEDEFGETLALRVTWVPTEVFNLIP